VTDEQAAPDDPTTAPFWAAARNHELVVQRCADCGQCQFYPRPFCLACGGRGVGWVPAKGTGIIYSITMVHVPVIPELTPPYPVAIVRLDEGPRLTTTIVGAPCGIGDRVRVAWRERPGSPPLPVFERLPG
jgi:uncharacterized OB-fold protein